ncbi:hypothetical protein [Psychroserpens mesophilus]|uniref:hypothetical protein n=1 Tax=Psychroserpens mesophilus TaxID=325473 RepID=UPI003D65BA3F
MKRERLPIKTQLKIGVASGLFFAVSMSGFDYFYKEPFSIYKFLFYFVSFGLLMAISFRYKYTKE